jgi:hypothetical protein
MVKMIMIGEDEDVAEWRWVLLQQRAQEWMVFDMAVGDWHWEPADVDFDMELQFLPITFCSVALGYLRFYDFLVWELPS